MYFLFILPFLQELPLGDLDLNPTPQEDLPHLPPHHHQPHPTAPGSLVGDRQDAGKSCVFSVPPMTT